MYEPSLVSSGIALLSPGKQKRYFDDLHVQEGSVWLDRVKAQSRKNLQVPIRPQVLEWGGALLG